jgi:predicted house-cleaning noncanonical NTP pyrophosphatase (MazG superfamily)
VFIVLHFPFLFPMKDKEHVEYTNITLRFINKMTDEIYEALIDKEYEDLQDSIYILIEKLNQLRDETLPRIRTRITPARRP